MQQRANVRTKEERAKVWETYVRSWTVSTAEQKRALIEAALSPHCVYRDPLTCAEGWDALVDYMLSFHAQIPGGHFVTRHFMAHGERSVARWELRGADDEVLGDGISYAEYAEDGKLVSMTGFFETPG